MSEAICPFVSGGSSKIRPGYLDALVTFWEDPWEGPVYFCGDYFAGPSTGGALYTGLECGERIENGIKVV